MQAHFSHILDIYRRWLFAVFIACLFIACLAPSFRSSEQPDRAVPQKKDLTTTRKARKSPAYDCLGKIDSWSMEDHKLIEQALDDAQKLLETCQSCRQMFSDDPNYAINLLKRLRRDKVIVITKEAPVNDFKLSADGKRLTVKQTEQLNDAGAGTQDVAGNGVKVPFKEMIKPCIYINLNGYIATGKPAENYALYRLPPHLQRALGILHELGHVAGAIADDGQTDALRNESVASTDCIRRNCVSCQVFECPGMPKRRSAPPRKKTKNNAQGHAGRARLRSPG